MKDLSGRTIGFIAAGIVALVVIASIVLNPADDTAATPPASPSTTEVVVTKPPTQNGEGGGPLDSANTPGATTTVKPDDYAESAPSDALPSLDEDTEGEPGYSAKGFLQNRYGWSYTDSDSMAWAQRLKPYVTDAYWDREVAPLLKATRSATDQAEWQRIKDERITKRVRSTASYPVDNLPNTDKVKNIETSYRIWTTTGGAAPTSGSERTVVMTMVDSNGTWLVDSTRTTGS